MPTYQPDWRLLLHPNLPQPLHGTNPRSILGAKWWKEQKQAAYAAHDYHCQACGAQKCNQKVIAERLEAHECYKIDYRSGRVELDKVVALCNQCHSFIHDSRLMHLAIANVITAAEYEAYLDHGNTLIAPYLDQCRGWRKGSLWKKAFCETEPFSTTFPNAIVPGVPALSRADYEADVPWDKWHLFLDGKCHYGRFENEAAWAAHYTKVNQKTKRRPAHRPATTDFDFTKAWGSVGAATL